MPLPPEMGKDGLDFQPTLWTDDDPYIIGKMLSFGMSSSLDSELLASVIKTLAPKFPADFPFCMPTRNAFTMPKCNGADRNAGAAAAGNPRRRFRPSARTR